MAAAKVKLLGKMLVVQKGIMSGLELAARTDTLMVEMMVDLKVDFEVGKLALKMAERMAPK